MQLVNVLNIFICPNCTACVRRTGRKSRGLIESRFSLEGLVELDSAWNVESVPVVTREI